MKMLIKLILSATVIALAANSVNAALDESLQPGAAYSAPNWPADEKGEPVTLYLPSPSAGLTPLSQLINIPSDEASLAGLEVQAGYFVVLSNPSGGDGSANWAEVVSFPVDISLDGGTYEYSTNVQTYTSTLITSGLISAVGSGYAVYSDGLTATSGPGSFAGGVYFPDKVPALPDLMYVVPEPPTYFTGGLLALSFGAGTLRVMRKWLVA